MLEEWAKTWNKKVTLIFIKQNFSIEDHFLKRGGRILSQ